MGEIIFTSMLDRTYQPELERLLFFNANQEKVSASVLLAVERYGIPRVAVIDGRLWVTFNSAVQAQSLFVIEQLETTAQLVGVAVYTREGDTLVLLFVAVREDRSLRGIKVNEMLYFRILDEVRRIGRHVKGIASITLFCPNRLKMAVGLSGY